MEGKNRQEGRGRKMRSVFEEIYSGKKFTGNSVPVRGRERENARRERAAEEAFRASLSEDQRKRFAEYLETVGPGYDILKQLALRFEMPAEYWLGIE